MKKLGLLFIISVFCGSLFSAAEDVGASQLPPLSPIRIDDDLFFAKLPVHDLFFACERVTSCSRTGWQKYAALQQDPRVTNRAQAQAKACGKTFSVNGSHNFLSVLNDPVVEHNQVWISYITRNPTPTHAYLSFSTYHPANFMRLEDCISLNIENPEAIREYLKDKVSENILMFVTVTFSPHAQVMSPMGISRSIESFSVERGLRENLNGLSPYLLSYAAQTLLSQNPTLLYMINTPAHVIPTLLGKHLPPNSLFVGRKTTDSKCIREKIISWTEKHGHTLRPSFEEFQRSISALKISEMEAVAEEEATMTLVNTQNSINEEILLKMEEDGISLEESQHELMSNTKNEFSENKDARGRKIRNQYFNIPLEVGLDGQVHYTPAYYQAQLEELKNSILERLSKQMYDEAHPLHPAEGLTNKNWVLLMMKYPPILEVGEDSIKIHRGPDSDEVFLDIEKSNPVYDWMFRDVFKKDSGTDYIAIKIKALASIASK